jgi:hypothetical protein
MSDKKMVTENDILDYIFQTLYFNLDRNEMHLEKDILASSGLELKDTQIEHLRELMMNSGMVNQSIGFGKIGRVYLNGRGIQIMKKYKTYHAYLAQEEQLQSFMGLNKPSHLPENMPATEKPAASKEDPPLSEDDMAH